tara:strand:+ start:52325 stop:52801 length:477 start_codon:yes stop_codon:yes gene_type:complete
VSDKPVVPQDYIYGLKVVDIGDLRIARGQTKRPRGTCKHLDIVYDDQERRIWCQDCEQEVEAYDAFKGLAEFHYSAQNKLKRREEAVKEAESFQARSRAVKALDQVWRSKNMTPVCPCCDKGLLPEDFANGVQSQMDRNLARKMRQQRLSVKSKGGGA